MSCVHAACKTNAYREASQTPVRALCEAAIVPPLVIPKIDCPPPSEGSAQLLSRGALKAQAAKLLFSDPDFVKTAGRVYQCGWGTFGDSVKLTRNQATGKGSFSGVKRCKSGWYCAECSARICALRANEVNDLLLWAFHNRYAVLMMTLTAAHTIHDRLDGQVGKMKRAKDRLRGRRDWRKIMDPHMVGAVVATETTHGANGWHTHFHVLIVMRLPMADALAAAERMRAGWIAALEGVGLSGNDAAFQVQGAEAACAYVTKFGAGEELALSTQKKGRKGGRTPFQLLADSRDGDAQASALWLEYARAFKGVRQLVWTKGLKAACGVADKADELAGESASEVEVVREWLSGSERWREARRRRISLMVAVADGDDLDAAEYGPTDQQRWEAGRDVGIKMETEARGRRRSPAGMVAKVAIVGKRAAGAR